MPEIRLEIEVLTTMQAAEYCNVSIMSINRWIDSGKIDAFKTPGGHRRVTMPNLLKFMRSNEIPITRINKNSKKRILIVDDELEIRKTFLTYLNEPDFDYEVDVAANGFEAGEKVSLFKPDLIVLDIRMPGIDGLNVCKKLKTDPMTQHIKIIILSGHLDKDNIDLAFDYGADKIFSKPILYDVIEEEIGILLTE